MPEKTVVQLPPVLSVKQLADALGQPVTGIIGKLMGFGVLATLNEDIDFDTAAIVADDYGVAVERQQIKATSNSSSAITETGALESRPPIVTIMGHVDHGKTTLLDTIRKTNVAAKEAGGITQHISSYQLSVAPQAGGEKRTITFLDTPGHSAFEAMRRHGAQITDLVVLVVAADDGIKPQTVEAINHARAMKVPVMVAINKIDKPGADIERVKGELTEYDLTPDDWGGQTVVTPISAITGEGVNDLLDVILLSTDIRDLKANPSASAVGVVVESHLQPGIGPVATLLIQNGTLRVGDFLALGDVSGKVRTLTDYKGKKITAAGPSTPVEISGISGQPKFGEQLVVMASERDARESARQAVRSTTAKRATSALGSTAKGATQKEGQKSILNVVIKADANGSLEAIKDTLGTMRNADVEVRIVGEGVGDISEGDISLAKTAKALVVGFQVRLPATIKTLADRETVSVSLFSVVYELFDAIREVLRELMPMETIEEQVGELRVLARFRDNRKNAVIGGVVEEGQMTPGTKCRILRKKDIIASGKVLIVRRGRDEVKNVKTGTECGLELSGDEITEVAVADTVVLYTEEKRQKALGL